MTNWAVRPGDLNPLIYSDRFLQFFFKVCIMQQPWNHLMMAYKYCPGKTIEADSGVFSSCEGLFVK